MILAITISFAIVGLHLVIDEFGETNVLLCNVHGIGLGVNLLCDDCAIGLLWRGVVRVLHSHNHDGGVIQHHHQKAIRQNLNFKGA